MAGSSTDSAPAERAVPGATPTRLASEETKSLLSVEQQAVLRAVRRAVRRAARRAARRAGGDRVSGGPHLVMGGSTMGAARRAARRAVLRAGRRAVRRAVRRAGR